LGRGFFLKLAFQKTEGDSVNLSEIVALFSESVNAQFVKIAECRKKPSWQVVSSGMV
jgi:hypothetical protein